FAVPLGYGLVQWLPMGRVVQAISPAAAHYWETAATMPWGARVASLSLAPDETLRRCGLYLGCLIIFLLLGSLARNRRYMVGVLCAVMVAAVVNAAQLYVQVFTMTEPGRALTGTFQNRNHFGFLMTMGIMAASGLLAIVSSKSQEHRFDHRNRSLDYEHPQALVFLLTFGLFFLIVAQALCLSRGAFLTCLVGLVSFWVIWARHQKHHHHSHGNILTRHQLAVPALLLVGALCVALPWVLEALSERYAELLTSEGIDTEGRLRVWTISLGVLRQFGVLGTGMGGFGVAVQPLDKGIFPMSQIGHAHNDVLELCCELGVPIAILLLALGVWIWVRCLHVVRRQHDMTYHWAGLGAVVALASCTAHELVEFSMLAWPNAFCFTALLAVATACRGVHRSRLVKQVASATEQIPPPDISAADEAVFVDPEEEDHKMRSEARHQHHESFRRNRWRFRLAYLAFAVAILLIAVPLLLRRLRGGLEATRLIYAQEAMQRGIDTFFLGGTVSEYRRLDSLATQALRTWSPGRSKLLATRAEIRNKMAQLTAESGEGLRDRTASSEVNDLRLSALEDLSEACRRVPGSGDYSFDYARSFEQAMTSGLIEATWPEVLAVYEWALSRQPGLVVRVREVANAYRRAWHWALRQQRLGDAVAYRQRAIDGFLHSLDLQDSNQVLMFLRNLRVPLDQILIHITPGEPQLDFFNSLLTSQDYATAAQVLTGISSVSPNADALSPEEWRLKLSEAKCRLAELTGNLEHQAGYWQECCEADDALQMVRLEEYQHLRKTGENWQANDLLRKLNEGVLPNCQVVLARARQMRSLGQPDEVVLALLPLTYSTDILAPELLVEAKDLLAAVAPAVSRSSPLASRKAFLEDALAIRFYLNSADDTKSREALAASVRRLEELDATLTSSGSSHWLQEHLIAYYAALGQEALGNWDQAVADYRLSLRRCPNFLWGVGRLAQLCPGELSQAEQQLLKWQRRLKNPIGFLSRGLQWLDLDVTPAEVTALHESVQCVFAFLCTDDFYSSKEWRATFCDRQGVVFQKRLMVHQGSKLLTTQVGELLLFSISVQPGIDTATGSHRSLQNGDLTITVGPCATRALTLQLRD
ncbi:MAG: O-antigen ligase family protein, partial [Victivallales bacterium]|nr:O-antigen ligase family protein [Victivallales bacterium]